MKGLPNIHVSASVMTIAGCLWEFGEDALADRALSMSREDHAAIQRISASWSSSSHQLPVSGQKISRGHVLALAAVGYFEGSLRPLARDRRRPGKQRPVRFTPRPPDLGPLTGGE